MEHQIWKRRRVEERRKGSTFDQREYSCCPEGKAIGGYAYHAFVGYAVMAIDVRNIRFGGVALLWEEIELYKLE